MNGQTGRRRFVTLIEIMIALLIMSAIAGSIAKAAWGALEESRYQRTLSRKEHIGAALSSYCFETGQSLEQILPRWQKAALSRLWVGSEEILKDGWGHPMECHLNTSSAEIVQRALARAGQSREQFLIVSRGLDEYLQKHPRSVVRNNRVKKG